jgi:hypothetical protein
MLFAVRIGPIETDDGSLRVFLGGRDGDLVTAPQFAKNDAVGLRALKTKAKTGPFFCEPALALAGRAAGFEIADPPPWLQRIRAGLAVALALGPDFGSVPPPVVLELLDAAEVFCRAQPWRHVDSDETLHATFTGPEILHFEASVLGGGGHEFGVALYEGVGAISAMRRARSFPGAAATLNSFAVTFDDGPKFAADALSGVFDLVGVPAPMRVAAGRPTSVDAAEVLILAATLRAAAAFSNGTSTGTGIVTIGELRLQLDLRRGHAAVPAAKRAARSSTRRTTTRDKSG